MQSSITVHQCLFGYKDGHRLLAASPGLPDGVFAELRVPSDLAAGVTSLDAAGYWTGLPIDKGHWYALMRTWPAPECPRPGCVWTHALLLEPRDLAVIPELTMLARYLVRPRGDFGRYSVPLTIEVADEVIVARVVSDSDALRAVRAAYSGMTNGAVDVLLEPSETMLALWSQQWPGLRKSFAFRSANSAARAESAGLRFDLRISHVTLSGANKARWRSPVAEPWEAATVADLQSPLPTALRDFLWRYGPDSGARPSAFKVLARLQVVLADPSGSSDQGDQLESVLADLFREFPSSTQGGELKRDLLALTPDSSALVTDPLRIWRFLLSQPDLHNAIALDDVLRDLHDAWSLHPQEMVSIAEIAAASQTLLSQSVLSAVGRLVAPPTLPGLGKSWAALRRAFVVANPKLLHSADIVKLEAPEVAELLKLLPTDEVLAETVIRSLLRVDDEGLVADLFARYAPKIIQLLIDDFNDTTSDVSPAWRTNLSDRAEQVIRMGYLERLKSTIALAKAAAVLGRENPTVLAAGPGPWARAIATANDDVVGDERSLFLAFLITLALADPADGASRLFEFAFEDVHQALAVSALPYEAFRLLLGWLPSVAWWQQWDTCLRLRMGVVAAFKNGHLPSESFARLASNRELSGQLLQLAKSTGATDLLDSNR